MQYNKKLSLVVVWWGAMSRRLLLFIGLMPAIAMALSTDKAQPINVEAQMVVIDEKAGHSIYSGNAQVMQGSLALRAEKIQIYNNQKNVIKVIAKGDKKQRAHYQQNQPNQSRFIEATAEKITYLISTEMVHLKGNAHLTQGFDSFSGGTLDYDIKNDKVIAKKASDGTQRVRFKIRL
jgi:lipopolysaccharide export system protein LptA